MKTVYTTPASPHGVLPRHLYSRGDDTCRSLEQIFHQARSTCPTCAEISNCQSIHRPVSHRCDPSLFPFVFLGGVGRVSRHASTPTRHDASRFCDPDDASVSWPSTQSTAACGAVRHHCIPTIISRSMPCISILQAQMPGDLPGHVMAPVGPDSHSATLGRQRSSHGLRPLGQVWKLVFLWLLRQFPFQR